MTKRLDLTGQKFGRLTAIEYGYTTGTPRYEAFWNCLCDCGKHCKVRTNHLTNGYTKSCGCLFLEQLSNRNVVNKLEKGIAAINNLYQAYIKNAKERNKTFNLTLDNFIILTSKNCYYCDKPPQQINKPKNCNGSYLYNGIDRVDNDLGYEIDNCVPCCKDCNTTKWRTTKNIILKAAEFLQKQNTLNK